MSKLRIAVVDDDRVMRGFVARTLARFAQGEISTFENGALAWESLSDGDGADIVVSDVVMPEMGGLELLARIRENFPDKVCILMSGDRSNEDAALALGANAFLPKPFTIKDLVGLVKPYFLCPPQADAS